MGAAPSLFQVMSFGWKVTLVWAFGANINTKFRLIGPWKWDGAEEVMKVELWSLIKRRPFVWGELLFLSPVLSLFAQYHGCLN